MRSLFLATLISFAALATAQSPLTTTLVGGLVLNGFAGSNTQYFNLTVNATGAPNGLIVTQINLRTQAGAAGSAVDIYRTVLGGTHVGNHSNSAAWTKISTGAVVVANPTVVVLDNGFFLAPGQYGFAVHYKNVQAVYTNPATQVPPLPNTFSTAEMTVDCTASSTEYMR